MILFIHINAKTVTVLILNQPGLTRWSLINSFILRFSHESLGVNAIKTTTTK